MNNIESLDAEAASLNDVKTAEPTNPFYDAPEAKKKLTLVGLIIAASISTAFLSVISTILPVAAREIGGADIYSFTTALTSIGALTFMPLWGYIAARKPASRGSLFCLSMLLGTAATLILATAQSMLIVIPAGPFFGAFTSATMVLSFTIIRDLYPPKQAGLYIGLSGAFMGAAGIAGPIIAGIAIQVVGWRMACHMFWPFVLLGCLLVFFGVKVKPEEVEHLASQGGKLDPISTICLVVTLTALVSFLSFGSKYVPFGSLGSYALLVVAIVSGALTVIAIRVKGDDAIVPISAVLDHDTMCFFLASVFTNFSHIAPFFFLPTYALYAMGSSAIEAALTVSAFTFLSMFLSPVLSKMIGESGNARTIIVGGTVFRIAVMILFVFLTNPDMSIWLLCALCLLGGIPTATYGSGFQAGPQIQLKPELRVRGNSLIQMGQPVGSSIGLSIYTIIMATFGVVQGMTIAMIVSAIAAGVALVFAMMLSKLSNTEE